jgi:metallo-beta-lactamase family protein
MAKKKLNTNGIFFTGKSAEDVTGSQYLVKFGNSKCLLECGLHQSRSNDYLDSYKINSEKFQFKPSELDFVFIAHPHIDHCGLIPRLVKEGFKGKIIATGDTAQIMKPLLLNSCAIVREEAKILSKRYKREYRPLYSERNVYDTFDLIESYNEYNKIYKLNDNISFQWLHNSHCLGAAQLQLILRDKNSLKKVLYTSDIGSLHSNNHYVTDTEIPTMFNDIVIMESTYGDSKRISNIKRSFDIQHLETAVNTVIERRGTVILPCFSFSRTQELLTILYDIYGVQKNFCTPIFVDSKLSCDISKLYSRVLKGKDMEKWQQVYEWSNVHFIEEKNDSQNCIANNIPKIIISSSGFCTNGRIVNYLKKYLKDKKSMIIFSGYIGDNPSYLSYRIKNYRENKFIKINKEQIPNQADCITLSTFSSHANCRDLVKYGSSLNTNKIVLVHGSTDAKKCLANKLADAISKNNKTYRVIQSFKGMMVRL